MQQMYHINVQHSNILTAVWQAWNRQQDPGRGRGQQWMNAFHRTIIG